MDQGQAGADAVDVGGHERQGLGVGDGGGVDDDGFVVDERDEAAAVHGEEAVRLVLVDGVRDLPFVSRSPFCSVVCGLAVLTPMPM